MTRDLRDHVNRLLLDLLVNIPTHRRRLQGDEAHPEIAARLREMARISNGVDHGSIDLTVNNRRYNVDVVFRRTLTGEHIELSGTPLP